MDVRGQKVDVDVDIDVDVDVEVDVHVVNGRKGDDIVVAVVQR